jgi:gluconolactonase
MRAQHASTLLIVLTRGPNILGVHIDTKGRLYAGCGDGVHVYNPSGTLIGKIFLGETSANFNFAGDGGMVICAETNLFYAKIAATSGAYTGDS